MGEAGRAFAGANFPVEVMVRRIKDEYARLVTERLPSRQFEFQEKTVGSPESDSPRRRADASV